MLDRHAVFDGAISISMVQWLCKPKRNVSPPTRSWAHGCHLHRFIYSGRGVLSDCIPGALPSVCRDSRAFIATTPHIAVSHTCRMCVTWLAAHGDGAPAYLLHRPASLPAPWCAGGAASLP
eukprot:1196092-Prorocentrum_minimum.AAC.4